MRGEGHGDPGTFFPLHLESPARSVAQLERRLCKEFSYCQGLPPFPPPAKSHAQRKRNRTESSQWPEALREGLLWRYREDLDVFGYTRTWHPDASNIATK